MPAVDYSGSPVGYTLPTEAVLTEVRSRLEAALTEFQTRNAQLALALERLVRARARMLDAPLPQADSCALLASTAQTVADAAAQLRDTVRTLDSLHAIYSMAAAVVVQTHTSSREPEGANGG